MTMTPEHDSIPERPIPERVVPERNGAERLDPQATGISLEADRDTPGAVAGAKTHGAEADASACEALIDTSSVTEMPRHESPKARDIPQPIGPERLRALREAIRSGQYPSQDDVRTGLVRMFRVESGED